MEGAEVKQSGARALRRGQPLTPPPPETCAPSPGRGMRPQWPPQSPRPPWGARGAAERVREMETVACNIALPSIKSDIFKKRKRIL